MSNISKIIHAYFYAKKFVLNKGFAEEIDWQEGQVFENLNEEIFLNEITWVIIASGLNDKVVRKIFPQIKKILFHLKSSKVIISKKEKCRIESLKIFNHVGKIEAILFIANYINDNGFEFVKTNIKTHGVTFLMKFPYIGKATSWHIAKNIGLNVAKPDRHLIRIASQLGYNNPNTLCEEISEIISEKVSIIDLVIWRYATLDKGYINRLDRYMSNKVIPS